MKDLTRTSIAHGLSVTDVHETWTNDGETLLTRHTVTHGYDRLSKVIAHCEGADARYVGNSDGVYCCYDDVTGHGDLVWPALKAILGSLS